MHKFSWKSALAWALAAFFLFGGIGNILAPEPIAADYRRWGYPDWFHFITGGLELVVAALLAVAATRFWGAALGCLVMSGAVATVALHGEYAHAIPPLVVLALSAVLGWATRPRTGQR
jgi:chromate transport protein ChrA